MNSIIVWVMMAYSSHGGQWIPTIEFKDEHKCKVAAMVLKEELDSIKTWGGAEMRLPRCVRIEK